MIAIGAAIPGAIYVLNLPGEICPRQHPVLHVTKQKLCGVVVVCYFQSNIIYFVLTYIFKARTSYFDLISNWRYRSYASKFANVICTR